MIHIVIKETDIKERHEYWISLSDKSPYYVCYCYICDRDCEYCDWVECPIECEDN